MLSGKFALQISSGIEEYTQEILSTIFLIFAGKKNTLARGWNVYKGSIKRIVELSLMLETEEIQDEEWLQIISMGNMKICYEYICDTNTTLKLDKEKILLEFSSKQ